MSGPAFTWTPRMGRAILTAANTTLTGAGTITQVLAGVDAPVSGVGPGGTKIFGVTIQAVASTTAGGIIRLWVSLDAASTWDLFDEISVEVKDVTVAGTTAARTFKTYSDLTLPNAAGRLGATTQNANAHRVWAHGGDLTG